MPETQVSPFSAAMRLACPQCGEGKLFDGFLRVARKCDRCGLALARNDSGDGPAVFLVFILGFLAVPLVLWIEFTFEVASWVPVAVGTGFVLVAALVLLRPAKAYVLALQYKHRREDYESGS